MTPTAPCWRRLYSLLSSSVRKESLSRLIMLNMPVMSEISTISASEKCFFRSSQTLFQLTDDERPLSQVHTQVDYTNFLIPSQSEILNSPFYWGKIDRYEAEALLANRPEGSFLLRDSAQDDFVFSVSFRRYGRSLHARIEEVRVFVSFRDDLNSGKSPVVVPAVFQGV